MLKPQMGLKRKTLKMGKREPWLRVERVRPLTASWESRPRVLKKKKKGRETKSPGS